MKRMEQGTASRKLVGYIKEKGFKGAQIMRATGYTKDQIYPVMNGKKDFTLEQFRAICIFIEKDPREFLLDEIAE